MISFRFHLVSIVAVFLALALGVLLGTTVVNQGVIDDLNRRVDAAAKRSNQLRDQVGSLQTQVRSWDAFGRTVEPLLVSNQLSGRRVVIVTQEGVDLAEVDGVRQSLQQAGATIDSVLFATPRMALTDPSSQTDLATILGDGQTDPVKLAADAAQQVAGRLAAGPSSSVGAPSTDDLLARLVASNFLVVRGSVGALADIGGPGESVVVLSGGTQDPLVQPAAFLEPFTAALAEAGQPVVAAETVDTTYPFVTLVRDDGALNGHLVTVDNADTMVGRIAIVLGLRDLLGSPAHGGHYGVKTGATSLIPNP